jgi:hypothetical protein
MVAKQAKSYSTGGTALVSRNRLDAQAWHWCWSYHDLVYYLVFLHFLLNSDLKIAVIKHMQNRDISKICQSIRFIHISLKLLGLGAVFLTYLLIVQS